MKKLFSLILLLPLLAIAKDTPIKIQYALIDAVAESSKLADYELCTIRKMKCRNATSDMEWEKEIVALKNLLLPECEKYIRSKKSCLVTASNYLISRANYLEAIKSADKIEEPYNLLLKNLKDIYIRSNKLHCKHQDPACPPAEELTHQDLIFITLINLRARVESKQSNKTDY